MKAYEIRDGFGLDQLREVERERRPPGPGEVEIAIHASSLNYRDLLMVLGLYNPKQKLPLVPLSDGAGTVVAVGPGVGRVKVGDRVVGAFFQRWPSGPIPREPEVLRSTLGGPRDGTLSEFLTLHEDGVALAPSHLGPEESATLPCAALTAWSALFTQASLRPGDTVLVQGTGGVSLFALQFAKMAGLRAIVTSSSDAKLERVRALGADATINYRQVPEWSKEARRLTDGFGVDLVVEVGGAGTLKESISAVRTGGQIALIGVLAGVSTELSVTSVLMRNIRIQGVIVGSRAELEAMIRAMERHRTRPVIDKVFAFDEARAAFEHLQSGQHFGKVCIRGASSAPA